MKTECDIERLMGSVSDNDWSVSPHWTKKTLRSWIFWHTFLCFHLTSTLTMTMMRPVTQIMRMNQAFLRRLLPGQPRKNVQDLQCMKCWTYIYIHLPNDVRTQLQTSKAESVEKCGHCYAYFGTAPGVLKALAQNPGFSEQIDFLITVDGVPLFKSSNTQLWPILCSFQGFQPFIIGIYCREANPILPMTIFLTFWSLWR